MKQLVFIHGRAQEFKDAVTLKGEWIAAFERGLAKSGLSLPITEDNIRFPYFGQTLHDLVDGAAEVADVIVRGGDDSDPEQAAFVRDYLAAIHEKFDVPEAAADGEVVERGVLNWRVVRGLLKGIDTYVPGGSSGSIALFTRDVYEYLHNPGFAGVIDEGVASAFTPGIDTVVVSHSLGTVVSHNVLRTLGEARGWKVPQLVTLGSPLAVKMIKTRLRPLKRPRCVGHWFNAMDPNDVVALYPLDATTFPVTPEIENKTDVDNHTDNQHGIDGYLDDAVVAKRIYDALVG